MAKTKHALGGAAAGWMGLALAAAGLAQAQSVTAVPQLDLGRFTGTWYEVARLPIKREKGCVSNAVQVIARADKSNRLQMVTSCSAKDGYTDVRNLDVKRANKSGDGKLKVGTTWPFYTKYWVLAVGPEYEWSLVGSPNHKTLWVLSKTPGLSPEVLTAVESTAAAEGFATAKLVSPPQRVR